MFGARHYVGLQRECGWMLPYVFTSPIWFGPCFALTCHFQTVQRLTISSLILSLCACLACHGSMPPHKNTTYSVSCYKEVIVGLRSSPLLIQGIWQYQQQNYCKTLSWATKTSPWSQPQLKEFVLDQFFKYYGSMILHSHFILKRLNHPVQRPGMSAQQMV